MFPAALEHINRGSLRRGQCPHGSAGHAGGDGFGARAVGYRCCDTVADFELGDLLVEEGDNAMWVSWVRDGREKEGGKWRRRGKGRHTYQNHR